MIKYLSNIMTSSNSNKKPFWHYVKSKRQDHSGISTLISTMGTIAFESSEKTEAFNKCFKSVFTVEDLSYIPDKGTSPYPAIPEINITLQGATNLLSRCDPHKSPDPDNLHAAFLKQVSMEIAPMLTHLFQQSLRDISIPALWKQAHVTPIYRKGDRSDPKNYHPVSPTSLICKTMEHILISQIMKHLESNKV